MICYYSIRMVVLKVLNLTKQREDIPGYLFDQGENEQCAAPNVLCLSSVWQLSSQCL